MLSRPHKLVCLLVLLIAGWALADTYDEHTLVSIETTGKRQVQSLIDSNVIVVGRQGSTYKALLTDQELTLLGGAGFKIVILHEEMQRDRQLFAEARGATAYYTSSTFNMSTPPAGSMMEHLLALNQAYPDITRLYDIGDTASGLYDIIAMKVTDNPDSVEFEPKIRIYGGIHGDEKSGMMVAADVLDWLLANYATSSTAQKLVEESEIWFIPQGNPDGNANSSRFNSNGVDLNRNFQGPTGCSEGPCFNQPETQAIRDLTEVTGKRFAASLSFHSGAIVFNSVYNYTSTATTDEPNFFSSRSGGPQGEATPAANTLAAAYQSACTTSGFWYTNGADWYITVGDTNDWSYASWSTLDTTLEVTSTKTPAVNQIPIFTAEHQQATINYMMKTFQGIHGRMTDSGGNPLDGTVTVTATQSASIPVPHPYKAVFTDPILGDYHRVLPPGTYSVECSSSGFPATTITGVVVTADTQTFADCTLEGTQLAIQTETVTDSCASRSPSDGILEAGEDGVVTVTLDNNGPITAENVSATLSTSTSGVTVVQNTASFANIPGLGSGASQAPHFEIAVASSVACGTTIDLSLDVTSDQGQWSDSIQLSVGNLQPANLTALDETFGGGIPGTWTVEDGGSGGGASATWNTTNPGGRSGSAPISAPFAIVDSDHATSTATQDESLITPVLDLSGTSSATLSFDHYFRAYSDEIVDVDVRSSATSGSWTNVFRKTGASSSDPDSQSIDISAQAAGAADVQVRFRYHNGAWDYYWIVDNIKVDAIGAGSCSMDVCEPIVHEILFADDFESGDTSIWKSSKP